ncbi:Legionella vir region protein [Legionella birminghamensis]|uniref:Legionella vir region protein n=1 Tax=Legionella birminghamensis TaxID=28083 RepID=A0A378JS75_9GAMM|nr:MULTISPECIES: DUF1566 domain-containing protein [Legionella]KTC71814.1 Legionella vir region protein [Legionella birminghamensis]MCW8452546.1 DUF1566 domain-containing protein [Legionella quinlivanii]STX60830.1 Legionella vir region protein [Legionella birminghamensis]
MNRNVLAALIGSLISMNSYAVDEAELWEHLTKLHQQADFAVIQIAQLQQDTSTVKQGLGGVQQEVSALQPVVNRLVQDVQTIKQVLSGLKQQIDALSQSIEMMRENQMVKHRVGEEYLGGIVFYVDKSGQHGLTASKIDVTDAGVQWRNGPSGNKITNAKGDGIGAGETNTRLIIAQQTIDNQKGQFAALVASQFQVLEDGITPCQTPIASGVHCHSAWYLPSAYELQLLYTNLHENNLTRFAPTFYWSSTERSSAEAWLINFSTGELMASSKSNTVGQVRAIARF